MITLFVKHAVTIIPNIKIKPYWNSKKMFFTFWWGMGNNVNIRLFHGCISDLIFDIQKKVPLSYCLLFHLLLRGSGFSSSVSFLVSLDRSERKTTHKFKCWIIPAFCCRTGMMLVLNQGVEQFLQKLWRKLQTQLKRHQDREVAYRSDNCRAV